MVSVQREAAGRIRGLRAATITDRPKRHPQTRLPEDAVLTLEALADRLAGARDSWWLIGGAAVALHGLDIGALADIDVIMSPKDARKVLRDLSVSLEQSGGSDRFRSEVFGHWLAMPIPVDIMGGFEVCSPHGDWTPVEPRSRAAVSVGRRTLYVPARDELIVILRRFGRPKDLARAEGLSALEA